jgi:hypothetical protein
MDEVGPEAAATTLPVVLTEVACTDPRRPGLAALGTPDVLLEALLLDDLAVAPLLGLFIEALSFGTSPFRRFDATPLHFVTRRIAAVVTAVDPFNRLFENADFLVALNALRSHSRSSSKQARRQSRILPHNPGGVKAPIEPMC